MAGQKAGALAEMYESVASRIDTGMMFINHPTWTTADLPFGGIKNSGYDTSSPAWASRSS